MSSAFVAFVLQGGVDGQSIYIGVCKLLGSLLSAVVVYARYRQSTLLKTLFCGIFALDLSYLAILIVKLCELGVHPLLRL